MLRGYWNALVAQSEPLAEQLLEAATSKAALQSAAGTIP
jgi:hypothetical protein